MFDQPAMREKPLSIAVLAMGGQGGGVLTDWIVAVAEANGWHAHRCYALLHRDVAAAWRPGAGLGPDANAG
jgi:indolepyruvate ferredoxin oxidoreductase beta subunit